MTNQGIQSALRNELVCLFAITLKLTLGNILHDIYRNFKYFQRLKIKSVALAKPKELLSFNVLLINKHCCSVFLRLTRLALARSSPSPVGISGERGGLGLEREEGAKG